MLKLVVRMNGQKTQSIELEDTATVYWAGRNENCQIPLMSEQSISRQHFKIFFKEGMWRLEVVSRFNELRQGEEVVRELTLQEGVSFSLRPYDFILVSEHSVAKKAEKTNSNNEAGNTNLIPSLLGAEEIEKTETRIVEKNKQIVFIYFNPESKQEKFHFLTENEYLVGRDKDSDIILDDARVSRRQFKLIRTKEGGYSIQDFQGVNGTYINKVKIVNKDLIPLNSGDSIIILNHRFSYEIRDADFQNKLQKLPSELLKESNMPLAQNDPMNLATYSQGAVLSPAMQSAAFEAMNLNGQLTSEIPESVISQDSGEVKVLNFWGLKIPLNKSNKMRLALGLILILILGVIASEDEANLDEVQVAERPADPYSKLSPEEQKQVKVQYELAKDLYEKGNYQLAQEELNKVHSKIPSYLDSEQLARYIEVAIQSMQQNAEREKLKREEAEAEERIQNSVAYCRQQIKPTITVAEIENCLSDVISLNPEHELIVKLKEEVGRIEEERKAKEATQMAYEAGVAELKKAYKLAHDIGEKDPRKGIEEFNKFLALSMPDPDKLLVKAKSDIARLKNRIRGKVQSAISSVKSLVEAGKHKQAIIALEKAVEVAPDDDLLREEIERLTEELRKKMQSYYQEAVVEENIGNIDTAKDRWRKILEQDIPNGEYHAKALIKLKKYGGP